MNYHPISLAVDRRSFLFGASALAFASGSIRPVRAADARLTIAPRQIEVKGKAAKVFSITGPAGHPGLYSNEGDRFAGQVLNGTTEPLVMHWHGQVFAPPEQDRSRPGGGTLAPGASDTHDVRLTPGTHWMHSHQLTEQQLLAAPMITRENDAGDVQDVVIMLHDFTFRSPGEILAELSKAPAHSGHGGHMPASNHVGMGHAPGGMNMGKGMNIGSGMKGMSMNMGGDGKGPTMGNGGMGGRMGSMQHGMGMMVHANDVSYDAYLANDRTLDDPDVAKVERNGRVRLRIINGASATAFFIDTGELGADCISVDGSSCVPYKASRFPLAQGQRIDLMVTLPAETGAFPILAQVEAARALTGIILATLGAEVRRIESEATTEASNLDLSLDLALRPSSPLPAKQVDRMFHVMLGEDPGYRWTINGAAHGANQALRAKAGERVEIMFMNPTAMMHPMHLHGHNFQLVGGPAGRLGSDP